MVIVTGIILKIRVYLISIMVPLEIIAKNEQNDNEKRYRFLCAFGESII